MDGQKSGRLIGAVLLIAGTTIGAAMLALPVSTGRGGLIPSLAAMLFMWLFLVFAALCLLEVIMSMQDKGSNLVTMARTTLGNTGKIVCWVTYLFLLYALNTAYISVTTSLFQDIIEGSLGIKVSEIMCQIPLLIIFSLLLRTGVKVVDFINRLFMFGLCLSFIILVALSMPYVKMDNLTTVNLNYVLPSLSIVVTAFGYHIIIPSLVPYLKGNIGELKKAIWIGSFIPFIAYALWQITTLGIVPTSGEISIESAYAEGKNGAQMLAQMLSYPGITKVSESFIFFAVITSFLGVSLSLFDFLSDGLKINKHSQGKWKLFFFTFVPPLYFALSDPRIFFTALEYAGAFGVVVLLALIPGLMVWRKRYVLHLPSTYKAPGGKTALAVFISLSICLVAIEVLIKAKVL
jgi:tyrosine-specific transport protein